METKTTVSPSSAPSDCVINFAAIEDALYVIGGKWKLKVIIALQQGSGKRFNELQRLIPGISARVLSNELKELELNGFVTRKVYPEKTPVVVEYVPTDYSLTLKDIVKALWDWGVSHRKKIVSSS
jgi:DNA-binding HxlR family transcriptional regulator